MAKATKKQALGRGLSALLKDPENDIKSVSDKNADKVVGNIIELELESIDVNPFQPPTSFNDETLRELATSIKEVGVIQPITVRKLDFNNYQLVSGERRFRASKLAGLKTIPAYIRIANDHESLTMALVENIQRQDLDPIEIALSYQRLIDEISLTDIYEKIIGKSLSVRETENFVRAINNPSENSDSNTKPTNQLPKHISKGIKEFSEYFGAKIDIKVSNKGSGKLIIPFSSEEDFKRLKKLINSED